MLHARGEPEQPIESPWRRLVGNSGTPREVLREGAEVLAETAPAKVNLSLMVLGRRQDGYHELASLVAFASVADVVSLRPGGHLGLIIEGPGADGLRSDDNLILKAARTVLAHAPDLEIGEFQLEKRLPVAAGIGGGSADAAAALRLIRRLHPELDKRLDWPAIARSLGADVPVCLVSRAALMTGLGEQVAPLQGLPEAWAVLANPGHPLATADVFRALGAPKLAAMPRHPAPPAFTSLGELIGYLAERPNDLEPAARRLLPVIDEVIARLAAMEGVHLARMSGSGPTCFGIFASRAAAEAASLRLATERPAWWVAAGSLR